MIIFSRTGRENNLKKPIRALKGNWNELLFNVVVGQKGVLGLLPSVDFLCYLNSETTS